MKQVIYAPNTVPTANIAVNKSRLKVYKNAGPMPTYYLQKGQEFQIELSNPTKDVILAKIILNGKPISQGGLVLNPGQRVFLDRYLDVAKKFLFDTYDVSNTTAMKKAIEDNGDFKVEFYRERQPYYSYGTLSISSNPSWITIGDYNIGTDPQFLRSGSTARGISGSLTNTGGVNSFTSNAGNGTLSTQGMSNTYLSNSLGDASSVQCNASSASYTSNPDLGATMDMLRDVFDDTKDVKRSPLRSKSLKAKTVETGRVEQGSYSDQTFKYVNKSFEYSPFFTVEYKLLPISQKINTVDDLKVKVYCRNCGRKLAKGDNYCGGCGSKA